MMLPCMSGPLTRRSRSTTWSLVRLIRFQLDRREPIAALAGRSQRLLALLDHHVGVVGVVGQLQPEILVGAEGLDRLPVLLEILVLGADLGIDLIGRLEARVEDQLREWSQLRAV